MSIAKYKVAQNTTENPRQTEYRLFAVVTKSLLASNGKERRDPEFLRPSTGIGVFGWRCRPT